MKLFEKTVSMFFLLLFSTYSVGPIFSVPGLTFSSLYSTITKPQNFPLCVHFNKSKTRIWPVPNTTESPYEENWNCISTLLDTTAYENGTIGSPDGVIIESDEITKSEVPYFSGYNRTFRVFYDWIHYYAGIESTFQKLKEKIEYEVDFTCQHEKAIISGYSLGGNFVRYFLTHFVDDAWKDKYIDSAMFFAAGVDGSFFSSVSSVIGKFFGIVDIERFTTEYHNLPMIRHMPSVYSMFPNFRSHSEYVATINGKKVKPSELFGEMKTISDMSNGSLIEFVDKKRENCSYNFSVIVDETSLRLYERYLPFLEEEVLDPGVPCLFVYNSAMPVICAANLTRVDALKYEYEVEYCGGDNVIPSNGMEYAKKKWKNVVSHDFNSAEHRFIHEEISLQKELSEIIKEFIENREKKRESNSKKKKAVIFSSVLFGIASICYLFI